MLWACKDPTAANSLDDGWYLHDLEAGGPKDVFKHMVPVALLQQMVACVDPFNFIDMPAASGFYNLSSGESPRCRMLDNGVFRLSRAAGCGPVADYLAVVWRCIRALGSSPGAL
ncbi:unnamed protein product [Prorocentrum cordatum]|uniref:Uncharacterized protein n=1 Tax=Prorocentrum cordatum TaxID=2364126 RepID=A0ABN9UHJ9_9DINO|nr:unnamed protein product [Polarella glacialis]